MFEDKNFFLLQTPCFAAYGSGAGLSPSALPPANVIFLILQRPWE